MPSDAVHTLVQQLRRHPLLEAASLEELTQSLQHRCQDVRLLGRELIQRGWLTPFQVNQLLLGRGDELIFGSYVLLERLGEAPVGELFKARHQRMRRHSALLVVRAGLLAQPEAVQRFYQEVQAVSQLTHRHLVTAYDAGPVGNTHFFATEFIEGEPLHTLVARSGALSVPLACGYAYQAALGLQHAYERGLLHHDLRPENLLLTKPRAGTTGPGIIKVANLGLTILYQNPRLTRDGGAAPAADYQAPERGAGQPEDVRAELYSLGCTLHYLLTGQPPFPGGTPADKARRHQEELPPRLRTLRPDASEAVEALLQALLAKQPDARPQSPTAVAESLAGLPGMIDPAADWCRSGGSTEVALPQPTHIWRNRRPTWLRRRWPYLLGAGLLLACGLLLGIGLLLRAYFRTEPPRSPTAVVRPPTVAQPPQPGTAQLIVECGRVKNGMQELERGQPGYSIRRISGETYSDWPLTALKSHCWYHSSQVQFEITVPPGTGGFLRLLCFDADNAGRKERVRVAQANFTQEIENFGGEGKLIELHLTPQQLKDGKIEVAIDNLGPVNAVISRVEFLTYRR
ncbi:MAG: serine/threonine protein kinase [Planctomycetia bacterium]|nr:serine/threonine protein kinase [Planctomycetia bacterium]